MANDVTNEDFDNAIADTDNLKIINSVCSRYKGELSEDVLKACGLKALWQCLKSHDETYNRKFTSSLYQFVHWRCKDQVRRQQTNGHLELSGDVVDSSLPILDVLIIQEYLEMLPENYRKVVYGKFFESKTYAEMGREMRCSRENVRQLLDRALERLRSLHFGV
jgi:RNA polymerase sigma factor (sigma-70 family)